MCTSCRTCFKFYCMFYFTCDRSVRQFGNGYEVSRVWWNNGDILFKISDHTWVYRPTTCIYIFEITQEFDTKQHSVHMFFGHLFSLENSARWIFLQMTGAEVKVQQMLISAHNISLKTNPATGLQDSEKSYSSFYYTNVN